MLPRLFIPVFALLFLGLSVAFAFLALIDFTAPIFNGKDLTGWRKVEPPKPPKEPAEWSVKDGAIHVEKGGGQLETAAVYDDFILLIDVRTNPRDANHHPNSGIFFRGDPNGYWTCHWYAPEITAFNTNAIKKADVPVALKQLADSKLEGKLGRLASGGRWIAWPTTSSGCPTRSTPTPSWPTRRSRPPAG